MATNQHDAYLAGKLTFATYLAKLKPRVTELLLAQPEGDTRRAYIARMSQAEEADKRVDLLEWVHKRLNSPSATGRGRYLLNPVDGARTQAPGWKSPLLK